MDEQPRDLLPAVAAGLVGIVALMHALSGGLELAGWATDSGLFAYVLLMVGGATLPLLLLGVAFHELLLPTPVYATLAVLMGLYLLLYAEVHAFGTVEFTGGFDHHDHHGHHHPDRDHDDRSAVDLLAAHLVDDPIALISKAAEATAMIVFTGLAVRSR